MNALRCLKEGELLETGYYLVAGLVATSHQEFHGSEGMEFYTF